MEIQQVNRTDPEKVYITVKNTSAAVTAVGDACVFDYTTEADGVSVILPTTALLEVPAGFWTEVVADDGYGLVQVWGHTEDLKVVTITAEGAVGDPLIMVDGAEELNTSATTHTKVAVLGETLAVNTDTVTTGVKAFIKIL